MSNADENSAGELLWQQARKLYEDATQDVKSIAAGIGVTTSRLIGEARKRGWKLRGRGTSAGQSTRATIQRLKELLQKRLSQLEIQIDELGEDVKGVASERDIRTTNTLVRTLEKVLELERKDKSIRARKARDRRTLDAAEREDLARRIAGLRATEDGGTVLGTSGNEDAAGAPAGLAILGAPRPASP